MTTNDFEKKWQELVERQTSDQPLNDDDRALIARDPVLEAEFAVLRELSDPETLRDDLRERAVAQRALAALGSSAGRGHVQRDVRLAPESVSSGAQARRARTVAWIAGGALAVAAGVALLVRPPAPEPISSAHQQARSDVARVPFAVASGAVVVDGMPVEHPESAPIGSTVELVRGTACLEVADAVFTCLGEGSKLRLTELEDLRRRVDLLEGRVVVSLAKQPAGQTFSVVAADIWSTAVGTMFSVEVNDDGVVQTAVYEGVVRVGSETDGDLVPAHKIGLSTADSVEIGDVTEADESPEWQAVESVSGRKALPLPESAEEAEPTDEPEGVVPTTTEQPVPAPPEPRAEPEPRSARQLLSDARQARIDQDWAAAADAYRAILRDHPTSGEAHAVLVSVGELELARLGDPAGSLAHFDRYLASGGPLAIEAKLGRIRALRALGRSGEELAAIGAFLEAHPDNLEADALRKRQAELSGR